MGGQIPLTQFGIDVMYHYCSLNSFVSIVKNKEFWLTRTDYTNDIYEMRYFDHQMIDIANRLVEQEEVTQEEVEGLKIFYDTEDRHEKMFIGCFSGKGEILSQWRTYADNAKGISMGFSVSKLISTLKIQPILKILNEGYVGYKVKYLDNKMLDELKEEIIANIRKNGKYKLTNEDANRCIENYYTKGEEFKFEEEYRILYNPKQKLIRDYCFEVEDSFYRQDATDFRIRDDNIISYWKMPIKDSIEEVILGPKCKINVTDVTIFLRKNGFNNVDVRESKLSYR